MSEILMKVIEQKNFESKNFATCSDLGIFSWKNRTASIRYNFYFSYNARTL